MPMTMLSRPMTMIYCRFAEAAIALRPDDLKPDNILQAPKGKKQGERLPAAGIILVR